MSLTTELKKQQQQREQISHHKPDNIENMGELVSPVKFVISRSDRNEYLSEEIVYGELETLSWHPHPSNAIKFNTLGQALAKAREIVADQGYTLKVCELCKTSTRYQVMMLVEVFPCSDS